MIEICPNINFFATSDESEMAVSEAAIAIIRSILVILFPFLKEAVMAFLKARAFALLTPVGGTEDVSFVMCYNK